jgi:2-C-methyl-D-erythritol 4-phosphate cytidylyltransferase
MHVTAVVVAAGKGLRLKSRVSKPLIKIASKPLIIYSLAVLSKHSYIKDIIVVANRRNLKQIRKVIKQYRVKKIKDVVLGGKLRQDSVFNGLKAMDSCTQDVLIHDSGRPFIDTKTVSLAIKAAQRYGAAIVGVPVKSTIKRITREATVDETIDRKNLWEIQTPQVFKKSLILKAYKKFGNTNVTDDAMLVEKLGSQVGVVLGTNKNIKITTPDDLMMARAIARGL